MPYDPQADVRLDPRVRQLLAFMPSNKPTDVASREEMIAEATTAEAKEQRAAMQAILDACDTEEIAPSKGLRITEAQVVSQPDGNTINLRIIRPDNDEIVPCVYYIHGGGMMVMSCYDGNYRAWGKIVAANGVAVVMVDFRNSIQASSVPEVAPFPAGLNDCVSGLKWTVANASALNIDTSRVVVAGESGGGNLALATALKLKQDGELGLVKGFYAFCPYIAGEWPLPENPSSTENEGIFISVSGNRGAMSYGYDEFVARNPLAWPGMATVDDVRGLPPVIISVNECDPLRDEGINFYRLLLQAGVAARCRQIMGTMHGNELFPLACPEITRDGARDLAAFARE